MTEGRPTKLIYNPAALAELGYTVDDLMTIIKKANMTNEDSMKPMNPGAVSGQQNSVTAHMAYLARKAEVDEVYWKNQAEGNKRMRAAMDAMPMGTPPNPANPLSKQIDGGHYKNLKIQPIEYIHANNIPFAEGCAIKYLTRWRDKGGVKDLEKAKHFIELLIELETRNG
jgi:hypothetical protein